MICKHKSNKAEVVPNIAIYHKPFYKTPVIRLHTDQTVLFLTFHFSISQQVKWFHVLLCITKNSIKHQSFVCTQLKEQTVLFQTIQFSISQQS